MTVPIDYRPRACYTPGMTTIRLNLAPDHVQTLKNILREVNRENKLDLTPEELSFSNAFEDRLFKAITLYTAREYVKDSLAEKQTL